MDAIQQSAARLGFESSETEPPERYSVQFVDYPFRDESATFADHLETVAKHEPAVAVAPDMGPDTEPSAVYEMGDELLEHADAVVVVPKREDTTPSAVPDRFRVGIPNADGFGDGTPWRLEDFRNAGPVHILGGSFSSQLEAGKHLEVASVDTSSAQRAAASWWTYWDPSNPGTVWPKASDAPNVYHLITASLTNAVRAWRERHGEEVSFITPGELTDPTEALGYGRPNESDADLWGPQDTRPGETPEEALEWEREQLEDVQEQADELEDDATTEYAGPPADDD